MAWIIRRSTAAAPSNWPAIGERAGLGAHLVGQGAEDLGPRLGVTARAGATAPR